MKLSNIIYSTQLFVFNEFSFSIESRKSFLWTIIFFSFDEMKIYFCNKIIFHEKKLYTFPLIWRKKKNWHKNALYPDVCNWFQKASGSSQLSQRFFPPQKCNVNKKHYSISSLYSLWVQGWRLLSPYNKLQEVFLVLRCAGQWHGCTYIYLSTR